MEANQFAANASDAAGRLDEDEKDTIGITDCISRSRQTLVINESGLYSLILSSRKLEAKRFNENCDRVPSTHFSVINELAWR